MTLQATFEYKPFADALAKAQTVVDRKSTSNVLANVLISSLDDKTVRILATDYDVTLIVDVPAEIASQGQAVVHGKSISDVVRGLGNAPVKIRKLENDWCEMLSERSQFKIAGISASDYPSVPITKPGDGYACKVPTAILRDIVAKTAFAMCEDETRLNLNGVLLRIQSHKKNTEVSGSATDGHRLCHATASFEHGDSPAPSVEGKKGLSAIIHKKGVSDLRKVMDAAGEFVGIVFHRNTVTFTGGNTTLIVRQIEDEFPDITRVIPSAWEVSVKAPRAGLGVALKQVAVLCSAKTRLVTCAVNDGELELTTSNPDAGMGDVKVPVETTGKPGLRLGICYAYLLDVIGATKGETLTLDFKDEFSPIKVTSPNDPGATFIIMPMRV